MPQGIRQSNLFIAEDWRVIYKSFRQVNFSSYSFDSIRQSMIDYMRLNYPEDYNDWTENSEFIALIDMMAWLGQSMAFRMDLNTRENFLDTVETKEGALRLARMLSYSPQRNYAASGLVKISAISTDEPIIDSENRNLSGQVIEWNSVSNEDWLEQFTLISNAAFNPTNPFGTPTKKGTVNNIPTEAYELNNKTGINVVYPFDVTISGETIRCELTNVDSTDDGTIFESEPDPYSAFRVLYRNDSRGNSSPNTGFFMYFKQGKLVFKDTEFSVPIENRVFDINNNNINETDVWLQEIDNNGFIENRWVKVPTVAASSNIIFNSLNRDERNIFSVITRADDQISLRFADGNFGNVPNGIYRYWVRTSNGLNYSIKPQNVQNVTVTIPYSNLIGQTYNLTISYSLEESVSNSIPTETLQQIKERAPIIYYTQDRMVNGEDYNVFPLIKNGAAQKLKASNRTYSGHSRFVDINDPTSTFQNTTVFSDDGIFYKEFDVDQTEVTITSTLTYSEIISGYISPALQKTALRNFVLEEGNKGTNFFNGAFVYWRTSTQFNNGSTGYFEQNSSPKLIGKAESNPFYYMTEDSLVNLVLATDTNSDGIWIKISKLTGNGNGNDADGTGTVTINERSVDNIYVIKEVLPSFSTTLSSSENLKLQEQIELKNTFGLGFDYIDKTWYIIETQDLTPVTSNYSTAFAKNKSGANIDLSWLIRVEYSAHSWRVYNRGINYVWESVKDVRFFYANDFKAISNETGQAVQDEINILKTNSQPTSNNPLDSQLKMALDSVYIYPDGYIEPRRVKVTYYDADADGSPDDPSIFQKVVGDGVYIFWEKFTSIDGYEYNRPVDATYELTTVPNANEPPTPIDKDLTFVYSKTDKTIGSFYLYSAETSSWDDVTSLYSFNAYGRKGLFFNWKHFASREDRIDPAITNIIDMFVLPTTYDTEIRNWIKLDGRNEDKPIPPTSDVLANQYSSLEDFKMISDEMIWRPTKYKVLFGAQADEELRAAFKVVKVPGASITDNEIKSRIVTSIDAFFDVSNWDFGETFYMTELAAFIHQRLATIVATVVLVPVNEESAFGNLYQVNCQPDEIFISSAKVLDIQIVDNLTPNNLRIGN